MTFSLGEQPNWAGQEPVVPQPKEYIPQLLATPPGQSLAERGFCVCELSDEVLKTYSSFHKIFEYFSASDFSVKSPYALQQFNPLPHAPNQYHGFSRIDGLKEQFMMRIGGVGQKELQYPTKEEINTTEDFGIVGSQLYEYLDQMCREVAREALEYVNAPTERLEEVLDPVHKIGTIPKRKGHFVETEYVIPGFVSSSIMDNFYYYNKFDEDKNDDGENEHGERFHNNHAAHSDSGLLTVVVVTDVPGLEVYDQCNKEWIAIEQLLHEYSSDENPLAHRRYATFFWSDSVTYLKFPEGVPPFEPCLHRVGRCEGTRYSVVFKQRTTPLATAPRYQEDYELAVVQMSAVDNKNPKLQTYGTNKTNPSAKKTDSIIGNPYVWISVAVLLPVVLLIFFIKFNLN